MIKYKSAGELAKALGRSKDTITDPKTGKVKVLAPPMPTHEPGDISGAATPHRIPYDSKEESEWADILSRRQAQGVILEWSFQPERFRIGDGAWYTPDFRVVMPDQSVVFHEIKGGRIREAARVRFLVCASLHPYRFILVQKQAKKEGGGWKVLIDSHKE
jgi:hypothetical protein